MVHSKFRGGLVDPGFWKGGLTQGSNLGGGDALPAYFGMLELGASPPGKF